MSVLSYLFPETGDVPLLFLQSPRRATGNQVFNECVPLMMIFPHGPSGLKRSP